MSDDDFDWDDYEHGRVVLGLCDALRALYIVWPAHGTDEWRIADWHDLMGSLVFQIEQTCYFCDWEEGAELAKVIDRHLGTATSTGQDEDGAAPASWCQTLRSLCMDIDAASGQRWPKPPPDDDEDEDE